MDLRQLRYFAAIAEAGSLSKASARVHVAQPTLSLHLANLETELGTKLFVRDNRGVSLTDDGAVLLTHATALLHGFNNAVDAVKNKAQSIRGRVTLGLPSTASEFVTVPLLNEVRQRYPAISLRLVESPSASLREAVQDGSVDLALLIHVADSAELSIEPLLFDELCLLSPPGSDKPREQSIAFWDAAARPLLLPSRRSTVRALIEDAAVKARVPLQIRAELDSHYMIKQAVQAGVGHSILPWSSVEAASSHGNLLIRRIRDPEISALYVVAASPTRAPSPAQMVVKEIFADLVRSLIREKRWHVRPHMQVGAIS